MPLLHLLEIAHHPVPNTPTMSTPEPILDNQQKASFEAEKTPLPERAVNQSGKFGVNIGQGDGIHIGDVYQTDPETIKRIVREELRLPKREYGDQVSLGLTALADLMQYPEASSAVVTFQVDFQAACDHINVIANYKAIHDLLHTLEFQCYSGIVQESRRFLKDDVALDILTDHGWTLHTILRDIKKVTKYETVATREVL